MYANNQGVFHQILMCLVLVITIKLYKKLQKVSEKLFKNYDLRLECQIISPIIGE